jgi:hypothetical protein
MLLMLLFLTLLLSGSLSPSPWLSIKLAGGAPLRSEYYDLVDAAGIAPSQSGNSNCFAL